MPTTIREQVLASVETTLKAIDPDNLGVDRNRDDEPTSDEMPRLVQFDGGHQSKTIANGEADRTLGFTVQGYVTVLPVQDGQALRKALTLAADDLYGRTVLALSVDATLGGLAVDIVETNFADPEFIVTEGDTPFAVIAIDFEVEFVTAEKDPYSL